MKRNLLIKLVLLASMLLAMLVLVSCVVYDHFGGYHGQEICPENVENGSQGLVYRYGFSWYPGYHVTGIGECTDSDIIIPEKINGIPVTAICDNAFQDCASITSVTIPNSVESIGNCAFLRCESLASVTIGNSVTRIESHAFEDCKSLTSITIPDSVTVINPWAFRNCTSLSNISIPNSLTFLGGATFDGCNLLQYSQYDNAYYIGNKKNPYLVLLSVIDRDITSCEIHNDTKVIYDGAFYGCASLSALNIPDSVVHIGGDAFFGCAKLKTISIPSGVSGIFSGLFEDCKSLEVVTLPQSIRDLYWDGFLNCESLSTINFEGTVEQWKLIRKLCEWDNNIGSYTIYCTDGTISKDGTVTYYKK